MGLIEKIINRPVFASVMSLLLIIFGIIGYNRLSLRRYPSVSSPQITVEVRLEGASPLIIERMITASLEKVLLGIEGLETISSTSTTGKSAVTVKFNRKHDIDKAAIDVRNRVGKARKDLPHNIQPPEITKSDLEERPVLFLALLSSRHSVADLADYAKVFMTSRLEAVLGVAAVNVSGAGNYEVRLLLDPIKMANNDISVAEVNEAVRAQHIREPGGVVTAANHTVALTVDAKLTNEEEFNQLIIKQADNYIIRLRDIGKAVIVATNKHSASRFNGEPAISISISKQSTANPLKIVDNIYKLLPKIRQSLPQGMELKVAHDETKGVRSSLNAVKKTIFEAFILVSIIVILVFGSFRAALIPVVVIPISLIGSCFMMYLMGFSLNLLTLLAFVLAIGLVVDDAIVVLENVYRYMEKGVKVKKAAIQGTTEIQFAIMAMTFTLAAVYAPIAITQGLVGALFKEFAITLVIAVVISGFVALTLSPVMCAGILKNLSEQKDTVITRVFNMFDLAIKKIIFLYEACLKYTLALYSKYIIILGVVFALLGGVVMWKLPSTLFPSEDLGYLTIKMISPGGFTIDRTLHYTDKINKILKEYDDIDGVLLSARDVGFTSFFISLKDWKVRKMSSKELTESLSQKLKKLPINVIVSDSKNPFSAGSSGTIDMVIKGRCDNSELKSTAMKVVGALPTIPGIKRANTYADSGREFKVIINREKTAIFGIKTNDVVQAVASLWKGKLTGKYSHNDRQIDVIVSLDDKFKQDLGVLSSLFIKGKAKDKWIKVPLSELLEIVVVESPVAIKRFDGIKGMNVVAVLDKNSSIGDVIDEVEEVAMNEIAENMQVSLIGEAKQYKEEQSNFYLVFLLAVLIIFLVLAAQYESYYDPIIILLSVPLSVAGAIITLKLTGGSLSIYSKIGLITLIGLITKHAIMIVEFANTLQKFGKPKLEAAITACVLRFRPIFITTLAMVLGAIPLALASGAGMESRQQIGWVIVGGMSFGTLFTLFFIPAIYCTFARVPKEEEIIKQNKDSILELH